MHSKNKFFIAALGLLLSCSAFAESEIESIPAQLGEGQVSEYQDASIVDNDFKDPLEPLNRFVFDVNDYADGAVMKPVAHVYEDITPEPVRNRVTNFMENLNFPINFVNFLLQGRFEYAGHSLARFVVNSTLGVAGLFDPATSEFNLLKEDTGFGDTLGSWGMEAGPYLVLPLFGPNSFRGSIGTAADYFGNPLYLATTPKRTYRGNNKHKQWYHWYRGKQILEAINLRQQYLKTLDDLKAESLNYYEVRRSLKAQETLERQKKIRRDRLKNTQEIDYSA